MRRSHATVRAVVKLDGVLATRQECSVLSYVTRNSNTVMRNVKTYLDNTGNNVSVIIINACYVKIGIFQ